jgi:4-hydroxybenzoate polyprenyltransferase
MPALIIGIVLLAAISTYNLWTKRLPGIGAINMGLCRGLSLLLGAASALSTSSLTHLPSVALLAALGTTLYIATVTNVARHETSAQPPTAPRQWPFVSLVATAVIFFLAAVDRHHLLAQPNLWLYLILAYTLYAGFKIHRRLTAEPAPFIPPIIGQLIRLLLPLQAAFCVGSHSLTGGIAAALLLILWPISRNVSKRFYAS